MTKSLDYEPSEDSDLTEDCDYVSDSDLEVDDEAAESSTKTNNPAVGTPDSNASVGSHNELAHQGKVVFLRGVSYLTSVKMSFSPLYLHTESLVAFRQS